MAAGNGLRGDDEMDMRAQPGEQPSPVPDEVDPTGAVAEPQPLRLHGPIDVRSISLAVLAVLASLAALRWAQEIVIPILMGMMMSYALTPVVRGLYRWRIPRPVSATVLLSAILLGLAWGAWSLKDQVDDILEMVPTMTQKIREMTRAEGAGGSAIAKVQRAASELEAAANEAQNVASGASQPPGRSAVAAQAAQVAQAARSAVGPSSTPLRIDLRSYLFVGTLGAIAFLGQIAVVFLVALFLLSSGDNFRRKMVKLAGPRLSQKKVTVETLDEISEHIQRYLLVQVAVSVIVGLATGLAFHLLGLNQAAVWGVVAGVTNLIPYVGAVIVGCGSALVGLVQFSSPEMGMVIGATSFAIHSVIGNVLTPWWMGRASRMSPVAVFIAVLLFGWLWGVWGLLLGVPILLVVKSVCDRVEDLRPVGELLGA